MTGARAVAEGRVAGRRGWLERTMADIAHSIEGAVFSEEHSRAGGWLQRRDPRAKVVMFVMTLLAASFAATLPALAALYLVVVLAARQSAIPTEFFVRRVWLGIPFFAGIIVVPWIFFAPGPRLFDLPLGPLHLAPSLPGVGAALVFVARVGVSVSLAVLLVLSTPWAHLLKSLDTLRVPPIFVLVLSMTYRYIFMLLHIANGMFEARKSRLVAATSGGEQRRWISGSMGNLLNRSVKMSNDVYLAMLARGFTGSPRTVQRFRMHAADWAAVAVAAAVALAATTLDRVVR